MPRPEGRGVGVHQVKNATSSMLWRIEKFWMTLRIGRDAARQVEETLRWLGGIVQPDDWILVEFPNYRRWFHFEFPLRFGDRPKVIRRLPPGEEAAFVIRNPRQPDPPGGTWARIFTSLGIEVWEAKTRAPAVPPLRWGLSVDEKPIALKFSRDALEKFLANGGRLAVEQARGLPQRFFLKTDLDVALWTNGHLRGSWVVENRPLWEGVVEAAIGAARDSRFKPLGLNELNETRVEITLMSDLRIPLLTSDLQRNRIFAEKGYVLQSGTSRGYYLPEVFNARRFRNLEEFLGDLAQEKAGLDRAAYKDADVFIFEVDDFIESEDRQRALPLLGPMVRQNFQFSNFNFQSRLRAAADWLCRIQEPDGNIPPIIDPLTGRIVKQIDWPRLAFSAWTLAEFGRTVQEHTYVEAAERSFAYLKRHILQSPESGIQNLELTLAYLGQLALALGKPRDATDAGTATWQRFDRLTFEPIAVAQIANFFKALSSVDRRFWELFQNLSRILKERFVSVLQARPPTNLALWAELVNTFWDTDLPFAEKVSAWLKAQQLENGAFPESTRSTSSGQAASDFAYTRGTGKIFEVLALDPNQNQSAIERVLPWLSSMQYDGENTFFVPEEHRSRILGGFRHDYFNPEAWVDAAGHVLLGGALLLTSSRRSTTMSV